MGSTDEGRSEIAIEARPTPAGVVPAEARDGSRPPPADATAPPDHRAADPATDPPPATSPPASGAPSHPWRRGLLWAGAVAGLAFGGYALAPTVKTMMETVSTDDAYVNGHVTYVAPRVAGQVSRVLVDDNDRVKQGGPAGPARQGAVPGPGRHQEGGRGQRRGRPGGRRGPGPGHPGPGPEPALEAPEGDRGRRRQGRAAPGPASRPCGARRRPSTAPGPTSPGPSSSSPAARSPARSSTSAARPSGRPRPRSSRPSKRSTRRGSPSASTRTPRGRT